MPQEPELCPGGSRSSARAGLVNHNPPGTSGSRQDGTCPANTSTALPRQPGCAISLSLVPCPGATQGLQLGPAALGCSNPRLDAQMQVGMALPAAGQPGKKRHIFKMGIFLKKAKLPLPPCYPFQLLFQELKCQNPRSGAGGNQPTEEPGPEGRLGYKSHRE